MKIKSLIFCLIFLLKVSSTLFSANLNAMHAISTGDEKNISGCSLANQQEFPYEITAGKAPGINIQLNMDKFRICSDNDNNDPEDYLDSPDDDNHGDNSDNGNDAEEEE